MFALLRIAVGLAAASMLMIGVARAAPVTLFHESFEGPARYSVTGGGIRGNKDFWAKLPSLNLKPGFIPSNVNGVTYFGGRDLNANFGGDSGVSAERYVTFDAVDLRFYTGVSAEIAFAARGGNRFERSDRIEVQASIDDGEFETVGRFTGPNSGSGRLRNEGGLMLSERFASFVFDLPETDGVLRLRVAAWMDGGGEAFLFDDIRITGNLTFPAAIRVAALTAVPEPPAGALLLLGLAGIGVWRRRLVCKRDQRH